MKTFFQNARKMCVGYRSGIERTGLEFFKIYDAETDSCTDMSNEEVKDLLNKGDQICNLYISQRGAVLCSIVDKRKLEYSGAMVVGVVFGTESMLGQEIKGIIGYDIVRNTGEKQFASMKEIRDMAFAEVTRNMTQLNGLQNPVFKTGGEPLYTRDADEEHADTQAKVEQLKQQLISVLTELDKIKPVQFTDVDCDNSVYNFSNVVIDESDNRVYIEMAMFHDNLPSHKDNPLKDRKGRDILPEVKA